MRRDVSDCTSDRITEIASPRKGYQPEETVMPTKKAPSFKTIPAGTKVSWHYRSAIGHGTVTAIHKRGTTAANTMYSIREHDHHPGEPAVVFHSGKALSRTRK
jgi:hypothetical protein